MHATLGDIYNYRKVDDRLSASGQPSEAELAEIARNGFAVVINLALHTDPRYALPDETACVRALGMDYIHIPMVFDAPREADMLTFFAALEAHRHQKVFVHCAANMRVSTCIGLYLAIKCNTPAEQAFSLMESVWQPNAIWSAFIVRMLAKYRPDLPAPTEAIPGPPANGA